MAPVHRACAWRLCIEPVSMTVCAWRLCTEPAWAPPRPCSHQTLPSAHCTLRLLWPHPDLAATTLLAVADKGLARQPPCLRLLQRVQGVKRGVGAGQGWQGRGLGPVSYTHLRAHETLMNL
eukprot:113831-Chlamydomonas_euryale.AAC.1